MVWVKIYVPVEMHAVVLGGGFGFLSRSSDVGALFYSFIFGARCLG